MADNSQVVFPPKGRLEFDGGLNSKFERSLIGDSESAECLNVVFGNGAVGTRGGSTKLNTQAIGSFVGDGLYTRRSNGGVETMVAFAGGTAWAWNSASFVTIASAQSVFTAGVRVGTAQMENHLFVGNGYVTPYKYNGTDWTRHGVPAATGVVSAVSATTSTGQLNGEYRYRVVYLNSATVAGDVGTATVTISVTNAKNILTGIPVAPQSHGVAARRIYRNFASGSTATYGLLTTLNDNTTTTYVDNTLDSSLGATYGTDQGEPPLYSVICQHAGRLFMNDLQNPGYLWYTEALEPYTVKVTNFLQVGDASTDLIKGLEVYDNAVVILCERAVYLLIMPSTDPTDWSVIKTRSPYGCRSGFSAALYNNKLLYGAMQSSKFVGFAALSGATIDPEATVLENAVAGSDLKSERIETDIFDVQELYVGNISAMVFKNKAYISVTYGDNQTQNNRIFVYDFSISNLKKRQEASWSMLSGVNAAQFTVYDGKLYFIDSTATGFVRQLETTLYNDDGAAINSYFWTKEYSGKDGHETLQKDFRRIKLLVAKLGAYRMNLTYRVDSDSGDGLTKSIDLTPGGGVWGTLTFGSGVWGGGRLEQEFDITLGQVTGKRIQLKFSNQNAVNQGFRVLGGSIEYNVKGKR